MSVTFGFYNSSNNDRLYDAVQMSSIFDGIINDGVYSTIGTAMSVTAAGGLIINVGIGRAWFNHTWTLNDAILPLELEAPELLYGRIDAVVLEVNATEAVRANEIKIVKGAPSASPQRPTLTNNENIHQHAIAYISVPANATDIPQANITSMVGTSEFPYVTGPLRMITIDNIVAQWGDQWTQWFGDEVSDATADINQWLQDRKADITTWQQTTILQFEQWWESLQTSLDGDVAASLAEAIAQLQGRMDHMEECCGTLQSQQTIFQTLQDNNGDDILDSSNLAVGTKVVFLQA